MYKFGFIFVNGNWKYIGSDCSFVSCAMEIDKVLDRENKEPKYLIFYEQEQEFWFNEEFGHTIPGLYFDGELVLSEDFAENGTGCFWFDRSREGAKVLTADMLEHSDLVCMFLSGKFDRNMKQFFEIAKQSKHFDMKRFKDDFGYLISDCEIEF